MFLSSLLNISYFSSSFFVLLFLKILHSFYSFSSFLPLLLTPCRSVYFHCSFYVFFVSLQFLSFPFISTSLLHNSFLSNIIPIYQITIIFFSNPFFITSFLYPYYPIIINITSSANTCVYMFPPNFIPPHLSSAIISSICNQDVKQYRAQDFSISLFPVSKLTAD